MLRILTDRGTEYCGNPERHEYELYLAVDDHSRTKTKSPQTTDVMDKRFFGSNRLGWSRARLAGQDGIKCACRIDWTMFLSRVRAFTI